jgi:hypothetical protein
MTVDRLIHIFAGSFILLSLALGVQGSPLFVSPGGWPSPPSSAPTCSSSASPTSARWASS